jgi:hypothetical protein
MSLRVFLSHSGRDASRVAQVASDIKKALADAGPFEVFNTSEPHYRYAALSESLRDGDRWSARAASYEKRLKRYLVTNLLNSAAYILLVTPASLAADSRWIRFEIEIAYAAYFQRQEDFFFPCVTGGARFAQLPPTAAQFKATYIDQQMGGLTNSLAKCLARTNRTYSSAAVTRLMNALDELREGGIINWSRVPDHMNPLRRPNGRRQRFSRTRKRSE